MKKQNHCTAICAAIGMLVLILDSDTALRGAREGITLCLSTLIPSLYPFIFLSVLLTWALNGQVLPPLRPIARICKMPAGTESLLAISFLGGYPVGAQCISLLRKRGQLTDAQAMRMIAFCNNAGPSFIFGILGTMFSDKKAPWLLWIVHIASALLVGLLLPGTTVTGNVTPMQRKLCIIDAFTQAIKSMASICGWVILIRMVLAFIESWFLWLFPLPVQVITAGILELSNGCIRISELECEGLRFLIASVLLSLGGICVTLQTVSAADGIPMKLYFPGKLLQCSISIVLSSLLQFAFPVTARYDCRAVSAIAAVIFIFILSFLQHSKKSSGIPATVGV